MSLYDFLGSHFLVAVICMDNGSRKWHPFPSDDDPTQTSGMQNSNYHIGVREVEVKGTLKNIIKQGIQEQESARDCYR